MQQGRVQVDADFNEQADIAASLDRTTRTDVIGRCGFPDGAAGFGVGTTPDARDLTLSPGRGYVEGLLCECDATPTDVEKLDEAKVALADVVLDGRQLVKGEWIELSSRNTQPILVRLVEVDVEEGSVVFSPALERSELAELTASDVVVARRIPTYLTQPYFPGAARALEPKEGRFVVYLDAWERHVTALEDDALREVALEGVDDSTRVQGVWQVKLKPITDYEDEVTCTILPSWEELIPASTGRLRARVKPDPDAGGAEPNGGYRGLENQLYRVEVHDDGSDGEATFKWSRKNASVAVPWTRIEADGTIVTASTPDGLAAFRPRQWIELTDDTHELGGEPGVMVKLMNVDSNMLTVDMTTATGSVDPVRFPVNPKARAWDDFAKLPPSTRNGFLELEDGIEVAFTGGHYNTGDYWLIPARTATGDIEWPRDSAGNPVTKDKDGVHHHYCALALVEFDGTWQVIEDCRRRFSPLGVI